MNHPPPWLEGLVHALLPPGSREHVLGDLSERYRTPGRYLVEALQALPGLITSQVRRTLALPRFMILLLLASVLFAVLGNHASTPLAAVLPTLLGLGALLMREAYRPASKPGLSPRQALLDVLAAALAVLLSQALVAIWAPAWLLPAGSLSIGLPAFSVLLFLLSLVQGALVWPPQRGPMSAADLLREARHFEALARLEIRLEQGGALVMAVLSLTLLVCAAQSAPATITRLPVLITSIGEAVGAAGGLLVAGLLQRQARTIILPMSDGMEFRDVLAIYRRGLRQRRQTSAHRWLYQLPTLLGSMIMIFGVILQPGLPAQLRWVLWGALGLVAAVVITLFCARRYVPDMLQRRLQQLEDVREKPASPDLYNPTGGNSLA